MVAVHVPVEVDPLSVEVIPYIRETIKEHQSKGTNVKVLMLPNPHNPLARVYAPDTVLGYVALAEEVWHTILAVFPLRMIEVFYTQFDLHLIVDEVFANEVFSSSYSPHPTPFISVLSLDIPRPYCDPARIHVLAGPTKDFGASGALAGALISQHNQDVINVVTSSLWAAPISSPTDAVFTAVMNDEAYCDWYLQENRTRLARAFELLAEWCEFHKLP